MGSRNGHTPIYIWYTLTKKGLSGIKKDVEKCLMNARYLYKIFVDRDVDCMLNDLSSTVVFKRPSDFLVKKWQLACDGDFCHIVVMPNIERFKLDMFCEEYFAN